MSPTTTDRNKTGTTTYAKLTYVKFSN
ncbi:hypothetical protein ACN42_g10135, partial [Penicillium freii]